MSKTFPQHINDIAENELKLAKYRLNITDSDKYIFDSIILAMSVPKSHYTYLYCRNLWLKPSVSDTTWVI